MGNNLKEFRFSKDEEQPENGTVGLIIDLSFWEDGANPFAEEASGKEKFLDVLQLGLAIGGIFLDPLDLVDAAVSAARGQWGDAALGVATAVPLLGIAAGITSIGKKAERVGRVFWSGGDVAKKAAMKFAKESGGVTLEMTLSGRLLEKVAKNLPESTRYKLWDIASDKFSKGLQGNVDVFHSAKGVRIDSVWGRIEYRNLVDNNLINYHIVE